MSIEKSAGGLVGHVRAVYSGRWKGFALPVDLLRAHLKALGLRGRYARKYFEKGERVAERARVSAAFADYLVSDDEAGYPFVNRRAEHSPVLDRLAVTGGVSGLAAGVVMRSQDDGDEVRVTGWHLDAPGYLAAGGMRRNYSELFVDADFVAPMLWRRA